MQRVTFVPGLGGNMWAGPRFQALASQFITFRAFRFNSPPLSIPLFKLRLPQSQHAFPLLALTHSPCV